MKTAILHGDIHLHDTRTRMPFRYGIATMTSCPHAFIRLHVEVDGRPSMGIAADGLPPKWFTKDPHRPVSEELAEMLRVIEHALAAAAGLTAESPFAVWQALYARQAEWGQAEKLPPLLVHLGTSLVERALIEAYCRAVGESFAVLLRDNRLGVRLSDIHPVLADLAPADLLPRLPLPHLKARHTIGMADLLTEDEITPATRLDDGLPQSLQACVTRYRLRHFKIKVSGDLAGDRDRLGRIAAVIAAYGPSEFVFSLDGNEHFRSVAEFRGFWDELKSTEALRDFFAHLLFIEQPLHRDAALDPTLGDLTAWRGRPRFIIDESDADLTCLPRALELGYAGTSHKNCKGVFKGIANACLLDHRRRHGGLVYLSGEDLANIGPVALLQDLAVCASLGIGSVERNGHHYFAGLSMFPRDVQHQVQTDHGDLYHTSPRGWPTLTIRKGALSTRSVTAAPFGVTPVIDVEQFPTVDQWRARHAGDA